MLSPFPGMDPYLEHTDVWHDFHEQFCMECRALLVPQLGANYIARVDEHVYVQEFEQPRTLAGRADVSVAESPNTTGATLESQTVAAAPLTCIVEPSVDLERSTFVEVRDKESRDLITVVELLSPSNKRPGPGREQYLGKRAQLLVSAVNLIELDFLRGGPRMPVNELPDCDYYALVSACEDRPEAGVWPLTIYDEMPTIPVPLKLGEAVSLNLRQALDQAFTAAGYANYIYRQQPQPPLKPQDAGWAGELLEFGS